MSKFCINCGQELENDALFCVNCGKEVKAQPQVNKKDNDQPNNGNKNKIAAGLFGIFLGCFGVHNFYLGYNGKGLAQLLITVLSCFILSPVSSLWGLIEGILILCGNINTDADGNPLNE